MVAKDPKMVTAMELMNPYEKPPSMSVSQSMRTFLYNRETGAFMGRTASSWGKRGVASFRISSTRHERNSAVAVAVRFASRDSIAKPRLSPLSTVTFT